MRNVIHNIKKKWDGPLEGSRLIEGPKTPGLTIPDTDDEAEIEIQIARQLLHPEDRLALNGEVPEVSNIQARMEIPQDPNKRRYSINPDGILSVWEDVVYADTEDIFRNNWITLTKEFYNQLGKPSILFTSLYLY
jgi:hypothetical protein